MNYLLTGKIYCGSCDGLYSGNSYVNKKSSEQTLLSYYKCQTKCGNTNVRKKDIEEVVTEKLINHCFSEEGVKEIVNRVQELYLKERQQTADDIEPIKKELSELEGKLTNWISALGAGIKSVIPNIKEAKQRKESLEYEMQRAELIQRTQVLDDTLIIQSLNTKKNTLLSANEEEKKQVLQEYVKQVIIQSSKDINAYDVDITYRVFNGGGELTLLKTLYAKYCF